MKSLPSGLEAEVTDSKESAQATLREGRSKLHFGPYEEWFFLKGGSKFRDEKQKNADDAGLAFLATGIFSRHVYPLDEARPVAIKLPENLQSTGTAKTMTVAATGEFETQKYSVMPMTFFVEAPDDKGVMQIQPLARRDIRFFNAIDVGSTEAFTVPTVSGVQLQAIQRFRWSDEETQPSKQESGTSAEGASTEIGRDSNNRQDDKPEISLRLQLSHPLPTDRINADYSTNIPAPVRDIPKKKSKLVIVGVIDDGLPFAHRSFLDSSNEKTRIDFLWMQGTNAATKQCEFCYDTNGTKFADNNIPFGKELVGAAIDQLREKHSGDEDGIYADPASGAIITDDPDVAMNIFNNFTHGAHVLELAAGMKPDDDGYAKRDQVRIVGVQLPRTALADTSGFGKEAFILAGVHYILDRANEIAKQADAGEAIALINVSLGATGGPKNGKSAIEVGIDEVVAAFRSNTSHLSEAHVYLPTGNNFDGQMAAAATLSADNPSASVDWRLQPNDRTESIMEVWFDSDQDFKDVLASLSFEIESPNAKRKFMLRSKANNDSQAIDEMKQGTEQIGQMSLDKVAGRYRFMVILAPTEFDHPEVPVVAPAGKWKISISIRPKSLKQDWNDRALNLFAIVQRDEDPAGTYNGGRQSYFVDPDYRTHNEQGRRIAEIDHAPGSGRFSISGFRTINGWATQPEDLCGAPSRSAVAGFTAERTPDNGFKILEPATYSAAGARNGAPPAVDTSAQSNRSMARPGLVGSGTRSGSVQVLIGTSAAAPLVVRQRVFEFLNGTKPNVRSPVGRLGTPLLTRREKS